MNDEEFNKMTAECLPKRVGRPIKPNSGTYVVSASVPMLWRDLMLKYQISASEALQQGVLMLLNNNPNFPQTPYEELLVKGVFVEKRRQLAELLSKLK
jgi:hypothetical protein